MVGAAMVVNAPTRLTTRFSALSRSIALLTTGLHPLTQPRYEISRLEPKWADSRGQ